MPVIQEKPLGVSLKYRKERKGRKGTRVMVRWKSMDFTQLYFVENLVCSECKNQRA